MVIGFAVLPEMLKGFTAVMLCFACMALPSEVSGKNVVNRKAASIHLEDAHEAAAKGEMSYASVSLTNPFEIVPAAGMELLEDGFEADDAEMIADLVSYAKKFIGTRYVYGGKSPKGFDCSGFTSYIFRQFGLELGASSSEQYSKGENVSRDEISAGDLLFFKGRNSRNSRVGHVAIAIDNDLATGEITFIHAAIGGGIRIDRISAPYYASRYLGARRVL